MRIKFSAKSIRMETLNWRKMKDNEQIALTSHIILTLRRSSEKNLIYFNMGPTLATFTPKLLIQIFWKLAGT